MKLSVVIPAYNEKATVRQIVERVLAVDIDKEVILVDDGSTDGTREIVEGMASDRVRIYLHDRNRGKGAALRTGFRHATGEIVIVQDADLEYDPENYPRLLRPIQEGKADVVYGSRFVTGEYRRVLYFWHMVGNKFLTFLSNMATNLNLTDMECGFKVFRRDVLESITLAEDRFGFEPEVTAKISMLDVRLYEVGISYSGRTYREGKKIGWKDGLSAIWCILRYNLFL